MYVVKIENLLRKAGEKRLIKAFELLAFAVSVAAFGYGAIHLFRKGISDYFKCYVYAIGCYMLEELWVIVNSLLGNGSQDGLVTVRLVGCFGCLCFMLSANANIFDEIVDEEKNRKAKRLALITPAILLALYAVIAFSPRNTSSATVTVIGFVSICPALFASYYNMKHLLLPKDAMGFLKITKGINILALVFYAANYIYPLMDLHFTKTVMSAYDLILAGILFGIAVLCRKGAVKWKALI